MGAARETTSDVAEEWQQAMAEFESTTGKRLNLGQINSMEAAVSYAHNAQLSFTGFRHDGKKVDRVRTAFSNNIDLIQRLVNGAQQVANAAGAFPPALPVAPLMMAFTCVFQTFRDVSADYDRVMGFFDDMSKFLDRYTITTVYSTTVKQN